jgi:CrcB protein
MRVRPGTRRLFPVQHLLYLALAGGLGSLSRYGLAGAVQRLFGPSFPYGTFVVNVVGCFLFGLVWGFLEDRLGVNPQVRVVVLTGFMGAFTTFSTYMYESLSLLQHHQWLHAAANMVGQNAAGLALIFLGLSLGRAL